MHETSALPFAELPSPPPSLEGGTVMARLVAGLGFRLHWATHGLGPADYAFRAHPEAQSIGEVLEHVGKMVSWMHAQCSAGIPGCEPLPGLDPDHSGADRRAHCLRGLRALEELLAPMDAAQLARLVIRHPRRGERGVGVLLNGPLADALTHVGQISAWRRQAGNPAPASDPFDGRPPA